QKKATPGTTASPSERTVLTVSDVPTPSILEKKTVLSENESPTVEELLEELHDSNLSKKKKAALARALVHQGTHEAIEGLLRAALSEPHQASRQAILEALSGLSNREGLESLVSALAATRDPAIVREVIETAGRMASPETVEFLIELYHEPPSIQGQHRAVGRALAGVRNPEAARSLANLASRASHPGLLEAAGRSLSKIGNPAAVNGLLAALENPAAQSEPLRESLLILLGRVRNPESSAYRATLLQDSELPPDVQLALARTETQHRLQRSKNQPIQTTKS
ncbi:MAG: HEAT repeat domain-containing protein, partial [Verrucomicrobiota bacterium]